MVQTFLSKKIKSKWSGTLTCCCPPDDWFLWEWALSIVRLRSMLSHGKNPNFAPPNFFKGYVSYRFERLSLYQETFDFGVHFICLGIPLIWIWLVNANTLIKLTCWPCATFTWLATNMQVIAIFFYLVNCYNYLKNLKGNSKCKFSNHVVIPTIRWG